ncbi:MAG: hypothetical protein ACPG8W_23840 [Candidatus Promineifilaceae bacterium]
MVRLTGNDLYSGYEQKFAQFEQLEASPKAISLGNSHALGLDFDTLGIDGYHLWLRGADLFEVDYVLSNTLSRIPSIDYVFVNLSYFSFHYDNSTIANHRQRRKWLYSATNRWRFISDDYGEFIAGRFNSIVPGDTVLSSSEYSVMRSLLGQSSFDDDRLSFANDGQDLTDDYLNCYYPDQQNAIVETGRRQALRHYGFMQETLANQPQVSSSAYRILEGIIQKVHESDAQLILYTSPTHEAYTTEFDTDIKSEMQLLVQQLAAAYAIPYYDYSHDPDFVKDDTLFLDAEHLNLCGAKKFSQLLSSELDFAQEVP